MIAWAFDCVLGIPLALTFAALAARTPDAGGVFTYASRAFGGAIGTVTGWYYFFAAATAQALVALTGAYYAAPYLGLDRTATFATAAAVLLVATLANLRGIRLSGRLQLTFAAVIALLLLIAIVVSLPRMRAAAWTPFAPHGADAIGRVAVTIFFAFFGWEAISHLSEEFHDPARDVPRSTAISVAVISALYTGVAIVTVGTASYGTTELNRTAIARLLSGALGDAAGTLAAAIALLISLGTANAFVAATSRLGYALARDGAFPSPIRRLNVNQVPTIAVGVVGGWAILCLLVSFIARWSAATLLVVPNSLVIIVYLSASLAAVKQFHGRRRLTAVIATIMVCALIPFAGVLLVIPAILAVLALGYRHRHRSDDNRGRVLT